MPFPVLLPHSRLIGYWVEQLQFRASREIDFNLALTGLQANANVRLLNANRRAIAVSNKRGRAAENIAATLGAGLYYIEVRFADRRGNTRYNLRTSATPTLPDDNTIPTAFDIGVLTTTYVRQEFVGPEDPIDFHKFTLTDIANLEVRVDEFTGGGTFELIRDDNNNGLVDSGEVYASSFSSLSPIDMPPGTYFIRVSSNVATQYQLTFVPTLFGGNVSPEPGNTLSLASNTLGVLSGTRSIKEYVGRFDGNDIYRFTLNDPSNLQITATASSSPIRGQLIRDANNNGLVDNGEVLLNAFNSTSGNANTNLSAGNYFLSVEPSSSSGSTSYALTLVGTPLPPPPPVDGNDTLGTASDIGILTTTNIQQGTVGADDPIDFYRFTLNDIANLEVRVEEFTGGGRFELIRDNNNNGEVDSGDTLRSGSSSFSPITMPPGTYFIKVSSNVATQYQLTFVPTLFGGNLSPDPGSTLSLAADLGVYSGTRSIREYVGEFDNSDIYRFTLNDLSNLRIDLGNADLVVQLYRDDNSNGLIEDNEIYHSGRGSLNVDMPSGNYFLGIVRRISSSASYEMTLVGTPYGGDGLPDPGNTLSAARDLGVLSGTSSRREYVGRLDSNDFYRFTLSNAANLQARLDTSDAGITLIQDLNNNGLIDNGENLLLGSSRNLQAGTYFVRVAPRLGTISTNYQLDLIVS
jgi:hypothetical protein